MHFPLNFSDKSWHDLHSRYKIKTNLGASHPEHPVLKKTPQGVTFLKNVKDASSIVFNSFKSFTLRFSSAGL